MKCCGNLEERAMVGIGGIKEGYMMDMKYDLDPEGEIPCGCEEMR